MASFFDNILDDAAPIGELPDLDQVLEFVDQEPNLSPPGDNEQIPHGMGEKNSERGLRDQLDRPILLNPTNESVLDKLEGEVLSNGFPVFDFDSTIMQRGEDDIAFENALKEVDDIAAEYQKLRSDGDKRSGDALNNAEIHSNENTNQSRYSRACADQCCKENVPLVNEGGKRRKSFGRKAKEAANGPSLSRKAHVETMRNVSNPRVSDVNAPAVKNRVPASSDANSRNALSFQRALGPQFKGHVRLNNAPPMDAQHQPFQVNIPNNRDPTVPATYNKPPGLTLASHTNPAQERSALLPQDLLSPASPLGMLPGEVRDELLTQARRQSYAAAEMRAIMMAQEAANNMYMKSSNGDANKNPANPNIAIPSAGMEGGQTASMQSVAQVVIAEPRAASRIPSNTSYHSRQTSLHALHPQPRATSNQVPVSLQMHAAQMRTASNNLLPQAVTFSKVSSADSHAQRMFFKQHPVAVELPKQINNSSHKLPVNANPVNANPACLMNNNGRQTFPQTASYPINATKRTAMNGISTAGPSNSRRVSKKARNSEVVAQTLANTYDQVNKLSATTRPGGRASRKSRVSHCEDVGGCSHEVPVSQQKAQQQVQPNPVASPAAPLTPAPTPDPTSTGLTAAAVRRQISQNRNGPRLRFSKNAGPSKYCHICGRSASTVGIAVCGNLPLGLCRKVLCDKCLLIHEPEKMEMAKTKNSGWTCTHCRNCCPLKARCHQYTRNNQKRREKNDQKKRMKRKLQEQQAQQEEENKRRRATLGISGEQPEEQRQGISPTGVPDGAFG